MATHSSSTCLALYCTGRLSSSVLTWYDWSEPRLCELFDVVRISLQLCHRWNAYWTKQLAHGDWLLCWLCRYIGCWFAGGGPRWSRWLHRRHPTSWPWAATGWWASCLMSMNLVMVVQNWLGSPGPGSVGWRPIRQTREERQTLEQNQTTTKREKRETKDHLKPSVLCGISNLTVFFQNCGIASFQLWQSHQSNEKFAPDDLPFHLLVLNWRFPKKPWWFPHTCVFFLFAQNLILFQVMWHCIQHCVW